MPPCFGEDSVTTSCCL